MYKGFCAPCKMIKSQCLNRIYDNCVAHVKPLHLSSSSRNGGGSWARTLSPSHPAVKDVPQRDIHEVQGEVVPINMVKGIGHLRDPRLNKGLAFTLKERISLGIHGLQPPRFKTQEEQLALCKASVMKYTEDLNRYLYLVELQERNERLFFRLVSENIEQMMPIVYTPTVGLACQKFGVIYRRPRGLFITIYDKGHVYEILNNWPEQAVRAICVTDGERILGLGDLGACGMGIPVGKLALYTALAGIKPHQCLPITIDVGTNNEQLRNDPHYIGLNKPRSQGAEYDELLDEFMAACVRKYGQNVLIQFEDFGNHNAFRFLDKYRDKYCTFNDDIQGTAAVAVAGILASKRITKKKMSDNKFVFLGAGEAAIGIADLCVKALEADGLSEAEARNKIWMMDIDGLLTTSRKEGTMDGHKIWYAKDHRPIKTLIEVVKEVKPSVLIGASAAAGAFTPEVLQEMAKNNERPLIFALSNPTSKAECTAQQAYDCTEGRCIFSSGSPFGEVNYNGKIYKPGQGNNAYIFPGVALGVIATGVHHIMEEIFLISAQVVADHVTDEDLERGSVYPPLSTIKECSIDIAVKIADYAYAQNGLASEYPEPKDKLKFIMSKMYSANYDSPLPAFYEWPGEAAHPRVLPEKL
ncbi:NADP-dependent malic enzyme-like isoform X2 [Leptopilina heterotoma]|uniref:NADP-dependent malic enzyme-like isoform X2 n=1 Tax=Leptopilina heterotoma TaxID=63436 RepID=UPI001CA8FDE9|nr:NADP-dependent malic enzyme-like isoform X2 [Leptopilina heterotoma]